MPTMIPMTRKMICMCCNATQATRETERNQIFPLHRPTAKMENITKKKKKKKNGETKNYTGTNYQRCHHNGLPQLIKIIKVLV